MVTTAIATPNNNFKKCHKNIFFLQIISNKINETVTSAPVYARRTPQSLATSVIATPSAARRVASIAIMTTGSITGNASTGYKLPFARARAIIAATIVEPAAIAKLPDATTAAKAMPDFTVKSFHDNRKKTSRNECERKHEKAAH